MQHPARAHEEPPFQGEKPQAPPGQQHAMKHQPDYGETSYRGFGRLQNQKALVTGADSGIGRAVALAFAREGADVAIGYLNEHADAEATRRIVEEAGRQAFLLPGDLSEDDACRQLVEKAARVLGRIDILVNNAAFQGKSLERFEDLDGARVLHTFKTNVISMFHMVRYALPYMREGATIINVGSVQAYDPSPHIIDYAATKGAIVNFTKALARELIERGIRVNCVAPGPVWTPLIVQSFDQDRIQSFGADNPSERPAQPAELAPAFVFLASNESSYVNGEVLGVTGGRLLA